MAIKWKNLVDKCITLLRKGGVWLISGFLMVAIGIFLYYYIFNVRDWSISLIAAGFLSIGGMLLLRCYLSHKYKNWLPEREDFYTEWLKQKRKQQFMLLGLVAIGSFFSFLCLDSLSYYAGYFMFFTVFMLYGVCATTTTTFMKKKLDLLMECMVNINQKNVESAIHSEKMKVELISNVSHDLKTPLTSMVGYIDLMKKEDLTDTLDDYVTVLSSKAEKLKEMIDSLFSLAKTSSGNIELKPEPITLNRLVEQIYADMEDQIEESNLEFVTELTAQDTEIITDSSYMYRICQNLMENALKYSAKNTRIFLKTAVTKHGLSQTIRFEITNTSNYRMNFTKEQITERFVRGDKARSGDGSGLGLAIVSTYTTALGGRFDVNIDCDQFKAVLDFEKMIATANNLTFPSPAT